MPNDASAPPLEWHLRIGRARPQLGMGLSGKWPIRVHQSSRPRGSEHSLVHDLVKIEKGCARSVEGHSTGDRMGIAVRGGKQVKVARHWRLFSEGRGRYHHEGRHREACQEDSPHLHPFSWLAGSILLLSSDG